MNLHLTRDEWDRIATEGRGVLFREGVDEPCDHKYHSCFDIGCMGPVVPPAEFVEAAKPCETCGGEGKAGMFCNAYADPKMSHPCDGQRRHPATVPCENPGCHQGHEMDPTSDDPVSLGRCRDHCDSGRITVAHVVVEWGPLVAVSQRGNYPAQSSHIGVDSNGVLWLWTWDGHEFDGPDPIGHAPPDVDPQSLVGQYAIGIKVVEL